MKNKKLLIVINVILVTAVLFSPIMAVEAANIETKNLQHEGPSLISDYSKGFVTRTIDGDIVWDNNMDYEALIATQWDEIMVLDPIVADDFQFEEDTVIDDLHWMGGYWNTDYQSGDFNWSITFYEDRGDEAAPGAILAGPFVLAQEDCNPILVVDTGSVIYYEFSVDFSEYIHFTGGIKYWLSIQGIGLFPPQSGFAYHYDSIKLHQAVFKSDFFGFPDWSNTENVVGSPVDLCFQLTKHEDNTPPTIKIEKPVKAFYIRDKKIFNRLFGLPIIIGSITVEVNATDNEGIQKVEFYGGLTGKTYLGEETTPPYSFTWVKDRIRLVHVQKLKVVVYDYSGNTASESMLVRKIL